MSFYPMQQALSIDSHMTAAGVSCCNAMRIRFRVARMLHIVPTRLGYWHKKCCCKSAQPVW